MAAAPITHTLQCPDGLPLRVDLHTDPERTPRAAVIVCHGFKGFKRWGFFPWLGRSLATAGYAAFVLDFSMNGIGDDPEEFGRLDLFERNTYTRELEDLAQVIDWARRKSPVADAIGDQPYGLLGHSRGALPVVVAAAERPAEVGAVVTWNGVGQALRYTDAQLERWEEDGRMAFTNARTGQRMAIDYGFVVDAREHAARFDLSAVAARMAAAHLIVHGDADMAVPLEEAEMLRAGRDAAAGCELLVIEGGTHTFGAVHPFAGTTRPLERAAEATREWFDRYLGR